MMPPTTFRLRHAAAALALGACLTGAFAADEPKVLNVYNWSDYIADDTLKNFEKETGIKVNYDNYDANEILHAKLVAGKTGYDIVVPGAHFAKSQIEGGLLQKLDRAQLTNWGNLDKGLLAQLAAVDPGNQYLVDWLWGYVTVGINTAKVKAALAAGPTPLPMPDNAWSLLFDPRYAAKLKGCGVSFLDTASEVIPIALKYLGKDPHSKDAADYKAVGEMLNRVRPFVTRFSGSGSDYIDQMARGQLCAVVGWSGDIYIAKDRAAKAKRPQALEALLPKSGGLLFFDVMAIPKDAKHPENALKWINYILRPEVAASLTNKVFYANPNKASGKFLAPQLANNPTLFLSPADLSKMVGPPDIWNNDIRRLQNRAYTKFKTGN